MAADRRRHLVSVLAADDISTRENVRNIRAEGFIHCHFTILIGSDSGPFNCHLV